MRTVRLRLIKDASVPLQNSIYQDWLWMDANRGWKTVVEYRRPRADWRSLVDWCRRKGSAYRQLLVQDERAWRSALAGVVRRRPIHPSSWLRSQLVQHARSCTAVPGLQGCFPLSETSQQLRKCRWPEQLERIGHFRQAWSVSAACPSWGLSSDCFLLRSSRDVCQRC